MNDYIDQKITADRRTGQIKLHGSEGFEGMRKAGRIAAETLDFITQYVVPGVTTEKLDHLCAEFISDHKAASAPLFYRGFPKSICSSINHVVCHGIPGNRSLNEGDIVNLDVTTFVNGWHGDSSRMFTVGKVGRKAQRLCDITYQAMMLGISTVRPGSTTGDIGDAIQKYAEQQRCSVVRDFCGHGIGRVFHDTPNIMHFGEPGTGIELRAGMFFTVEPMINLGTWQVKLLTDGWTAVTKDRSLSAQFEHTIGVTETGYEIFTQSPRNLHKPPFDEAT